MSARPAPKSVDPYYRSKEHEEWAHTVKERAGFRCEECGAGGRTYADHIVEIRDGGSRADPMNGQCLCARCHTKKTVAERLKRMERK